MLDKFKSGIISKQHALLQSRWQSVCAVSNEVKHSSILACPSMFCWGCSSNGCLLSTVQKTWDTVHGCIKACCSKSMRFCNLNIHISNIINTFFHTSTDWNEEDVQSNGIGCMRYACLWEIKEQRKHIFFKLAKENLTPLGLYWNPLTFFL